MVSRTPDSNGSGEHNALPRRILMKSLICLAAISMIMLGGCATASADGDDAVTATACSQRPGHDFKITYGDSGIQVDPPVYRIKRNSHGNRENRIVIALDPKVIGYGAVDVSARIVVVRGKEDDPAANWILGIGNHAAGLKTIIICVPERAFVGTGDVYFRYEVEVEDVGLIDPRVKVEN